MERNRRVQVVLGMIRHVPHHEPDERVCERRSRVRQTVLVMTATGMLDDQDRAEQGLS